MAVNYFFKINKSGGMIYKHIVKNNIDNTSILKNNELNSLLVVNSTLHTLHHMASTVYGHSQKFYICLSDIII